MMLPDIVLRLVDALNDAEIPHMIVGSVASSQYGEPRSTADVDMVIDTSERSFSVVVERLRDSGAYVGDWQRAFADRDMFNAIDTSAGWKIDLMIRKDRPFSRSEFERRIPVDIGGAQTWIASPEDVIVSKLEWAGSGSERQIRDVIGIISAQIGILDTTYIAHWCEEIGILDRWLSVFPTE